MYALFAALDVLLSCAPLVHRIGGVPACCGCDRRAARPEDAPRPAPCDGLTAARSGHAGAGGRKENGREENGSIREQQLHHQLRAKKKDNGTKSSIWEVWSCPSKHHGRS